MKPFRQNFRLGCLNFRDPFLLCGVLYLLLWFDASSFLRIGLWAAVFHEMGHILVYGLILRRKPQIDITMTGFCLHVNREKLSQFETLCLAAAGPGTNLLLVAIWAFRMNRQATLLGSAFLAANLLTAVFNLLPVPPLDGWEIWKSLQFPRK